MASNRVLCVIILAIWSWSLLQFTMVLTASPIKSKKVKVRVKDKKHHNKCCHTAKNVCCSVDVWSILINIILQDAPFFIFRLLLILHYKIISETNIFFTCKVTNVFTKFVLKESIKNPFFNIYRILWSLLFSSIGSLLFTLKNVKDSNRIKREKC